MIPLPLIIPPILALITLYFLYTFFRTVFKIVAVLFTIMLLGIGVLSYYIIQDIKDVRGHATASKLYILTNHGRPIAALKVSGSQPIIFDDDQLNAISASLAQDAMDRILADNHQLFIYATSLLKTDGISLKLGSRNLSGAEALSLLNGTADKNLKAFIFVDIINSYAQDGASMIRAYKRREIILYPESLTFKVLRYIPDSVIDYAQSFARKEVNNVNLGQTQVLGQ